MSSRPRVVDDVGSATFEVDGHGHVSDAPDEPAEQAAQEVEDAGAVLEAMGWTPEEAGQFICAIWNMGMLIYGPEWAADPRETAGWDISAAQLLDQVLPKGTGGIVGLAAALLMVGNGLAMMAVRRIPIIKRGPRPMWVRTPKTDDQQERPVDIPPPSPPPRDGETYHFPASLVPKDNGLGAGVEL